MDELHFKTQALLGYPDLHKRFEKHLGYPLDLNQPKTYSHWIQRRKITDSSALRVQLADKLLARSYIKARLGNDYADRLIVPVLTEGNWGEDLEYDSLPNGFVLKANHGSGFNHLALPGAQWHKRQLIALANSWLTRSYGRYKVEKCYTSIRRRVFIEPLLISQAGTIPDDIKIHVFFGRCAFIQVHQSRFQTHTINLYTADWAPLAVRRAEPPGESSAPPPQLGEMLNIASTLAHNIDYIRVDFYISDGRVYIGELTNYPGSGFNLYKPVSFDVDMGGLFGPGGPGIAREGFNFLNKYKMKAISG